MSRWGDLIPHQDNDNCLCGCQDEDEQEAPGTDRREAFAAYIYEHWNPGHRWGDAHPDDRATYLVDADVAMAAADSVEGAGKREAKPAPPKPSPPRVRQDRAEREGLAPLTIRLAGMLELRASGWTPEQIGEVHGLKQRTVAQYLQDARKRLGADTLEQAIEEAERRGLIDLDGRSAPDDGGCV